MKRRSYKNLTEKVKELDTDNKLNELWEFVYNKRMKKHGDRNKAVISANSAVYSECLKMFIKEEKNG